MQICDHSFGINKAEIW